MECFYLLDQTGEILMEHPFRNRTTRDVAQAFAQVRRQHLHALRRGRDRLPPVWQAPETQLQVFHLELERVCMLCTTSREVEAAGVLGLLQRIALILEDYLGGGGSTGSALTAEALTSHLDTITELLCEVVDNGQTLTTERNALQEMVLSPSLLTKLMSATGLQSSLRSGQGVADGLAGTMLATPNAPWRRPKIKYASNEIFVDLTERVTGIVDGTGKTVASLVQCAIHCETKLSGTPDVMLLLKPAAMMTLPTFHRSVRVDTFLATPGTLSFIPPDGKFELASWTAALPMTGSSPLPFSVQFIKGRVPTESVDIVLTVRAAGTGVIITDLVLTMPLPFERSKSARCSATSGETTLVKSEEGRSAEIVWTLGAVSCKTASRLVLTCSHLQVDVGTEALRYLSQARVSCGLGGKPVTGISVESLKMARVGDWKPYKGVKYSTRVEGLVFRSS